MNGVRFAPSPTGIFHAGNFRTAWISHAWARKLGAPWIVRVEDIDQPRVVKGAAARQLEEMATLGLAPDRILVQSMSSDRHWETFRRAVAQGRIYPCFCSRKDVREALEGMASAPHGAQPVYSGHCRELRRAPEHPLSTLAWRFQMPAQDGSADFIVGRSASGLDARGLPDPASFVPAYQWACAVDDYDGGYELLVRAHDLADVLPQQRAVQLWLAREEKRAFDCPAVFHCSLVVQDGGDRLEKRTRGVTLPELEAAGIGREALLRLFAASFDPEAHRFEPGRSFGEAKERLTLGELGIRL